VATVSEKVNATSEIFGRLWFSAAIAVRVSDRPDSVGTSSTGLADELVAGEAVLVPVETMLGVGGGWAGGGVMGLKAASSFGAPTPLGPS
jgi:hypothetical protein